MPRVRRRRKAYRAGWSAAEIAFLCYGEHGWLYSPRAFRARRANPWDTIDRERAARAWRDLGPEIMRRWVDLYPGTRPWAWWEYDAPERRRLVSGPGYSYLRHPAWAAAARYGDHGAPRALWTTEDFDHPSRYETEVACLERLGLLGDDERAAIAEEPGVADIKPDERTYYWALLFPELAEPWHVDRAREAGADVPDPDEADLEDVELPPPEDDPADLEAADEDDDDRTPNAADDAATPE